MDFSSENWDKEKEKWSAQMETHKEKSRALREKLDLNLWRSLEDAQIVSGWNELPATRSAPRKLTKLTGQ